MAQEHWLSEKRLTDLHDLGVQFAARSGMEDALSSGILRGRPFGGVSIAWSQGLDHVIKPLVNYRHKRIISVEMSAKPHPLLFISVYMPFLDARRRQECLAETIETITMLDEIVTSSIMISIVIMLIGFNYIIALNYIILVTIAYLSSLLKKIQHLLSIQKKAIFTLILLSDCLIECVLDCKCIFH